ncbi:IGSF6 protein, partial [Asarcornis scutulata]|nr:IGSF6 protein [Asarcornis scutulata]
MASFNSFQKMLMLAFNWILYSAGAADKCQVTVRQPRYQKAEYSTQTVSLPCDFSAPECSPSKLQVLWFRFFTNKHEDLCTPTCTNDQKFKVQISENSTSLQINDLTVNDSAVYFCGIAFSDSSSPHSKQTGGGTILTKRGQLHSTEEFNCMIVISTLLLLYCTAVFTILIVYKKITSGRKIFQAIAQELQKQRYAEHSRQPDHLDDDTVYQNR